MKERKKLPVVLYKSEAKDMFDISENLRHKTIQMTIYAAELRVSGASNFEVTEIDSKNMRIRVCNGKGKNDIYALL